MHPLYCNNFVVLDDKDFLITAAVAILELDSCLHSCLFQFLLKTRCIALLFLLGPVCWPDLRSSFKTDSESQFPFKAQFLNKL